MQGDVVDVQRLQPCTQASAQPFCDITNKPSKVQFAQINHVYMCRGFSIALGPVHGLFV